MWVVVGGGGGYVSILLHLQLHVCGVVSFDRYVFSYVHCEHESVELHVPHKCTQSESRPSTYQQNGTRPQTRSNVML